MFFVIFLSICLFNSGFHYVYAVDLDDTTCSCSVGALDRMEQLNSLNYRRIRIEYRDGLRKYSNYVNTNTMVECRAVVVYEKITDPTYGKVEKQCSTCINNQTDSFWSELTPCNTVKCDREFLIGNPLLNVEYGKEPSSDQQLFLPGKVVAILKFGTERRCKICQLDGEWSKYSEIGLCISVTTPKPNTFCRQTNLREQERQEPEYIRLRIESPDGLFKYSDTQNQVLGNSIAVYQKYESSLVTFSNDLRTTKYQYLLAPNTATKKYCRYCDDGEWSDLEPCVAFKCDKDQLTGEPELLFLENNVKPPTQQFLFNPFTVIAVYTFGGQKFCKQCHENGEWSRYSVSELCSKQTFAGTSATTRSRLTTKKAGNGEVSDEVALKESSCSFKELKNADYSSSNYLRMYVVSPDRKRKIDEDLTANAPSRSFALYETADKVSNKHFCRSCINGVWSNITLGCSKSLYFCDRDKLYGSATLRLPDNKELPDDFKLFEPGTAMAVYEISESTILCKVCETNGEWSRYAEPELCQNSKAFWQFYALQGEDSKSKESCVVKDLDVNDKPGYIRISVETEDGKQRITSNSAPYGSIAIYQNTDPDKSVVRWCRKCENGKWQSVYSSCPIEFSILKCDPLKLRGVSYFVRSSDGSRLTEREKTLLALPGDVVAVFVFSDQKYCKLCQEDGDWSRYQETSNCNQVNWTSK